MKSLISSYSSGGKVVADRLLYADKCCINDEIAIEVSKILNQKGVQ